MSTKRVEDIESQLRKACVSYYIDANPIMSDAEYDRLRDELSKIDPDNAFLQEVGVSLETSKLAKVKHEIPMGSLDKITAPNEYTSWLNSIRTSVGDNLKILVQWKYDGCSIELLYKNGKFVQAVTRGDGIIGEDVTHSIKNASGFPKNVSYREDFSVRGEAFLLVSDWEKYLSDSSKNPRNMAVGICRRTSGENSHLLKFVAYDLCIRAKKSESEMDIVSHLATLGFNTAETIFTDTSNVLMTVADFEKRRDKNDFQTDGAVIKLNSKSDQMKLGGDSKGLPKWARAWKFAPDSGYTKIVDVVWSMGSRGTIHPTAVVDPVNICGVTITNVSLHNLNIIAELGVYIGDKVEIVRAGDVIPKVCRVVEPAVNRKSIVPQSCPGCGGTIVKQGAHIACSKGQKCPGVQVKRLSVFVSKREIMHLGESAIQKLVDSGIVNSIPDLYDLNVENMVNAGIGETMSKKILGEIEKSRKCTLAEMLGSLSIDLLGRTEASNLVDHGIDTIDAWKNLSIEKLIKFERFGEVKASRIIESLKENWEMVDKMSKKIDINKPLATVSGGSLAGTTVCFTGTMTRSRKELEQIAEDNGAKVKSSVTAGLTYLVMADPDSGSTKAQKARDLGTKTISEEEFLNIAGV